MSLTAREKRILSKRIGSQCKILTSGITQLYMANPGCEPMRSTNPIVQSFKSGECEYICDCANTVESFDSLNLRRE